MLRVLAVLGLLVWGGSRLMTMIMRFDIILNAYKAQPEEQISG